jgi:hypothetical protein
LTRFEQITRAGDQIMAALPAQKQKDPPPPLIMTGAGVRRKVTGTAGAFREILRKEMTKDGKA